MKNHSRFSWTHKCSIRQRFAVSYSRWWLLCFPRLVSRNRAPGLGGQSNQMDTTLWVFYGRCLPSGAAFFSPEKYAAFPPGTPVVNRSSACSHERWKIAHLHLEQLCLCESSTNYIHLRKGNIRIKYTSSRQLDQPWTRPAEMLSYRRKHRAASSWRTREWRGGGLGSFERLDTCLNEFCASCSDRFS